MTPAAGIECVAPHHPNRRVLKHACSAGGRMEQPFKTAAAHSTNRTSQDWHCKCSNSRQHNQNVKPQINSPQGTHTTAQTRNKQAMFFFGIRDAQSRSGMTPLPGRRQRPEKRLVVKPPRSSPPHIKPPPSRAVSSKQQAADIRGPMGSNRRQPMGSQQERTLHPRVVKALPTRRRVAHQKERQAAITVCVVREGKCTVLGGGNTTVRP